MQHNGIGFDGMQKTEESNKKKWILASDENKHTCFISLICSNIWGIPERDQVCLLCSGGNVPSYKSKGFVENFEVCISHTMFDWGRDTSTSGPWIAH